MRHKGGDAKNGSRPARAPHIALHKNHKLSVFFAEVIANCLDFLRKQSLIIWIFCGCNRKLSGFFAEVIA
jgi:hypothetical protein